MFEGTEIQGRGSDERMCGCEDGSALSWMDFTVSPLKMC